MKQIRARITKDNRILNHDSREVLSAFFVSKMAKPCPGVVGDFNLGGRMGYILVVMLLMLVIFPVCLLASNNQIVINMDAIKQIESAGNPKAFNEKSKCRGLFQISEICLKDFNQQNNTKYSPEDLFSPIINEHVADWYMFRRIPEFLKSHKKPITTENLIIAWNAGIRNVLNGHTPTETKIYLKKYYALARSK